MRKAHAISSPLVPTSDSPRTRADRGSGRRIRRQHRELLHHLDHGPVRDPLPVGQAAAPHDTSCDAGKRLGDEPRLAHPGVADHRHELTARLCLHPLPRLGERSQLSLATDEPRRMAALGRIQDGDEAIGRHRMRLSLQRQRLDRLRHHRFAHERERRLADQDLRWRSGLLEARRDVDGVPGRKPLLRPRHHLARVDADAAGDPELGQRVAHLHRRPACA